MRIGPGPAPPPLPPNLPTGIASTPAAPDRAILVRVAALAAGAFGSALDRVPGGSPPLASDFIPVPIPAAAVTPTPAAAPLAAGGTGTVPGVAPPAAGSSALLLSPGSTASAATASTPTDVRLLPLPVTTPSTSSAAVSQAAASGERLTLSPASAALRTEVPALTSRPAGQFMLEMIDALTGEPRSQLQLFAPGAQLGPDAGGAAALAALAAKTPDDVLQLLVQGRLRSLDAKLIDLSFGLSVQRQPGSAAANLVAQEAIRTAIEQFARTPLQLEYPGAAAALAGHRAQFQAVLDPRGLWPLQSFYLSGLLIFGPARDEDEDDDDEEEWLLPDPESEDAAQAFAREPSGKKKKQKSRVLDEPTPLPADGGLPIISARRWLELELRHVRSQLRRWMALPPPVPGIG